MRKWKKHTAALYKAFVSCVAGSLIRATCFWHLAYFLVTFCVWICILPKVLWHVVVWKSESNTSSTVSKCLLATLGGCQSDNPKNTGFMFIWVIFQIDAKMALYETRVYSKARCWDFVNGLWSVSMLSLLASKERRSLHGFMTGGRYNRCVYVLLLKM